MIYRMKKLCFRFCKSVTPKNKKGGRTEGKRGSKKQAEDERGGSKRRERGRKMGQNNHKVIKW